jgi:hypothetical protein
LPITSETVESSGGGVEVRVSGGEGGDEDDCVDNGREGTNSCSLNTNTVDKIASYESAL